MYVAMFLFALSMSLSPGPVNLISMNTGSLVGFRPAMHFVSGATIGFIFQLFVLGLATSLLVTNLDAWSNYLRYPGAIYMLYLAFMVLQSTEVDNHHKKTKSGFLQGLLIQWVNPKAWLACAAGISAFVIGQKVEDFAAFLAIYFVVCFCSIALWAGAGSLLMEKLKNHQFRYVFNLTISGMLVVSAIGLFI